MRRLFPALRTAALLMCFVCWQPSAVGASPVLVDFYFPFSYADLEFGPALGYARIVNDPFDHPLDDSLTGPNGKFSIASGVRNLVSGPLLSITDLGSSAHYLHDAGGTLSIDFDLELPGGGTHHGTFAATFGTFTIRVCHVPSFCGETTGELGSGLFDDYTAKLLGIHPQTLGGSFERKLFLDTNDFYPEPSRVAKAFGEIGITAVAPEPSLLLLTGSGFGAMILRAIRQRQR